MKKKYVVKQVEGLTFKGTLYNQGDVIELSDAQYAGMKNDVKLEIASPEQIKAYDEAQKKKQQAAKEEQAGRKELENAGS